MEHIELKESEEENDTANRAAEEDDDGWRGAPFHTSDIRAIDVHDAI